MEWLKPGVIIASLVYSMLGILVFWLSFLIIDKITPYDALGGAGREAQHGACPGRGRDVPGDRRSSSPRRSTEASRAPWSCRGAADDAADPAPPSEAGAHWLLLASVFVVAACGLVYELIAGAVASYLLGDSVLQFSTVIGCYLFAMGIGSWLSRFLVDDAAGALPAHRADGRRASAASWPSHCSCCTPSRRDAFRPALYAADPRDRACWSGLEIPLVMRLLRQHYALKDLVSQVLTFDYLGALVVSLAFPLVLVPQLGMVRTGLFFGLCNALVGGLGVVAVSRAIACGRRHWRRRPAVSSLSLGIAFVRPMRSPRSPRRACTCIGSSTPSRRRTSGSSSRMATDDLRLYLNRNLQFSSRDEYRYHEALVHPVLAAHPAPPAGADPRRRRRAGRARSAQVPGASSASPSSTWTRG